MKIKRNLNQVDTSGPDFPQGLHLFTIVKAHVEGPDNNPKMKIEKLVVDLKCIASAPTASASAINRTTSDWLDLANDIDATRFIQMCDATGVKYPVVDEKNPSAEGEDFDENELAGKDLGANIKHSEGENRTFVKPNYYIDRAKYEQRAGVPTTEDLKAAAEEATPASAPAAPAEKEAAAGENVPDDFKF